MTNICSHVKQNLFPDGILVATSHVWNSSRSTGQIREGSGIEREKEPDQIIFFILSFAPIEKNIFFQLLDAFDFHFV